MSIAPLAQIGAPAFWMDVAGNTNLSRLSALMMEADVTTQRKIFAVPRCCPTIDLMDAHCRAKFNGTLGVWRMCILYSMKSNQKAIAKAAKVKKDSIGNLPLFAAIAGNDFAPVVRNTPEGRELAMLRWGMPSPESVLVGKKVDPGVHNVRNTASRHWKPWLGVAQRCVVPFTSFSEFDQISKCEVWYAEDEERPLRFFAGIWLSGWTGIRRMKEGSTTSDLFAFLTTAPSGDVKNANAMPVMLTTEEQIDHWLTAPVEEALRLQHSLPDGALTMLGRGMKTDGDGVEAKTFMTAKPSHPETPKQGDLF